MNTNYYLAKTNAGNSLFLTKGKQWINFAGDSQGKQDGFDLYGNTFISDYKNMIVENGSESFGCLWNNYNDNNDTQVTTGKTENIDDFMDSNFESFELIISKN